MSETIQTLTATSYGVMSAVPDRYAANDWYSGKPSKLKSALDEHPEIHEWAMNEFTKEWNDLPPPKMGGQPDDWKKQHQQRLNTCFAKVKDAASRKWHIIFAGVAFLTFLVFGFGGIVLLILGATFSWFVECWLDDHYKIQQARMAAGYA